MRVTRSQALSFLLAEQSIGYCDDKEYKWFFNKLS